MVMSQVARDGEDERQLGLRTSERVSFVDLALYMTSGPGIYHLLKQTRNHASFGRYS